MHDTPSTPWIVKICNFCHVLLDYNTVLELGKSLFLGQIDNLIDDACPQIRNMGYISEGNKEMNTVNSLDPVQELLDDNYLVQSLGMDNQQLFEPAQPNKLLTCGKLNIFLTCKYFNSILFRFSI